ncbi:MAG: HNH endonuclease [Clostridiales bacterium]|nr:HNH endonuclease [Clostridiales bacterium]
MMDSPSFCYKFYWLDAIVTLITENCTHTTFNDIIDEMIADAWYSVVEFHIHLSGIVYADKDNLEKAVTILRENTSLANNASKTEIKNAIKANEHLILKEKKTLTNMVPYKALSGFFINHDLGPLDGSIGSMVRQIQFFNSTNTKLPYTLGESTGLAREVIFDEEWAQMIKDNTVPIKGWIQHEKVKWLQRNNPEIPGLVYKLVPLDGKRRKLEAVRNLWEGVFSCVEINDVFTGKPIDPKNYDVDHFVPFSFVMNDELWNLMPMDPNLNSGKNNNLPSWNDFFGGFANNQFILYEHIHRIQGIFALYEKCYKDNLHSIWATQELYRKGNTKNEFCNILEKNMRPVYDSAYRQGYSLWKMGIA